MYRTSFSRGTRSVRYCMYFVNRPKLLHKIIKILEAASSVLDPVQTSWIFFNYSTVSYFSQEERKASILRIFELNFLSKTTITTP
jgi:hypothetical protein